MPVQTKLYKRDTHDVEPTTKFKDDGDPAKFFSLMMEDVLHAFCHEYPNLISFDIDRLVITKKDLTGTIRFHFYLPPELVGINFQFAELSTKKFDRRFILPMPHRYVDLTVNFCNRASYTSDKITYHTSGELSQLRYTLKPQHDQKLDKNPDTIGSFLPNSADFPRDRFCPNWSYSKSGEFTVSTITDAVFSMFENYCWSYYNNHWFNHLFYSPAFFMLMRDFGSDIKFTSTPMQKLYDLVLKCIKDKISQDDFRNLAMRLGGFGWSSSENLVPDYYQILSLLDQSPNYWLDLPKNKIIQEKGSVTTTNTFLYYRGSKSKIMEVLNVKIDSEIKKYTAGQKGNW